MNGCVSCRAAVSSEVGRQDELQALIQPLRKEVDIFFRELRGLIRAMSAGMSPQAIRNRQRLFGFRFVNNGQVIAQEEEPIQEGGEVAKS